MIVLTILLTALKILLKILLVLLLVILALLLIILLVPIRYESHGKACMQSINIQAKVTWLLRLLRIQLAVKDDHIAARVMVLTFTVFKKNIEWQYPLAKMSKDKNSAESSPANAPGTSPEDKLQNASVLNPVHASDEDDNQSDASSAAHAAVSSCKSSSQKDSSVYVQEAAENVTDSSVTVSESGFQAQEASLTGSKDVLNSDFTGSDSPQLKPTIQSSVTSDSNQSSVTSDSNQSSVTSDANQTFTIDPSRKPTITRSENVSVKKHSRKPKWKRQEEKRKKMAERAVKKQEKAEAAAQKKADAQVRKAEKAVAAEQKKAEAEIKKAEKEAKKSEKQAKAEAKKAEKEAQKASKKATAKGKTQENTNLNAPENAEAQIVNPQITAAEAQQVEAQPSENSTVDSETTTTTPAADSQKNKKKGFFRKKPKEPELVDEEEEDVGIFPEEELQEEEEKEEKEPILDKIKKGWEIFQQKSTKKTISRVKKCIFGIIGHILPNRVKIRGLIGMKDPSLTGQILGVFYMFYPKYSKYGDYKLVGDFEKFNLNIKYMFDGYIRIGTILFKVLSLLIDRNIRKLIIFFIKKKK